jgi:MoaA/NifB/PqqE/SkfB family radical SAM enzyme
LFRISCFEFRICCHKDMALPLIKVVQVTLTNRCQCRCKHCGVSKLREVIKGELTIGQIDTLFQDLRLAGCIVVDLFGGEPTLRRDLFDIIARGKSYGFSISLETNGYVIDEAYMDGLVAAGLDQIYLSLDDYRPEKHDAVRRKVGAFDRAVRALELGAKSGIMMHVSTVPQSRDFFLSGDMNRFVEFVRGHGAEKVRLLLPRFVGDSIHEDGRPMCAGEERELFSHVSDRYRDFIYLHTPGTPLGEKNLCTAKQVFCHVMSNGWVAPCPYFPLVFGDATREPIIDVFERIQSHPLVRLGGEYCPMRNEEYIDAHMRGLGLDHPFFPITVDNQIDLGAPCGGGCSDCAYGARAVPRPVDEVLSEIGKVASEYTRIEFYGGDALLRDDLFSILERVPHGKKVILWSTCEQVRERAFSWERLRAYPVEAIKLHLSVPPRWGAASSEEAAGLQEALRRTALASSLGPPVHLYVPMETAARFQATFVRAVPQLGVERLYAFTKDFDDPLVNSVGCFGRGMGRARILWVKKREDSA